jgi:hypothetical protein
VNEQEESSRGALIASDESARARGEEMIVTTVAMMGLPPVSMLTAGRRNNHEDN